jgi:hypothetical protein
MFDHRHIVAAVMISSLVALPVAFADDAKEGKEACIESHSKGQDAKEQGKLSLARKLFLACAQSGCPTVVQSDCARFADDLTRMQPTLNFAARDTSGADLPDTSVYVDDVLIATRLDDGRAYEVDPGKRVIKFFYGSKEQTQTVVVGAGEKGRTISVTFGSASPAGGTSTAAEPIIRRKAPTTSHPGGAKLLLGVGAALTVGGATMGVLGLSRVPADCSVSTHECAAPPGDALFSDASRAVQLSNIGWVMAGLGIVAVAGGTAWYFGGETSSRDEKLVAPWVTPDGAGVAVMGRY